MPGASFHSFFWAGTGAAAPPDPPLGSSASGGYVPWMTTVTVCSMLFLATRSWGLR